MKRFPRVLRWSAIAFGVLALLTVAGALYEPIAEGRDARTYRPRANSSTLAATGSTWGCLAFPES